MLKRWGRNMAVDHGVAEPVLRHDQKASLDLFPPAGTRSVEDALEGRRSRALPQTFSYLRVLLQVADAVPDASRMLRLL